LNSQQAPNQNTKSISVVSKQVPQLSFHPD
jgi:hypothetical protein